MTSRMSEKHFQQTVTDMAKLFGWMTFHPFDSRRSTPGFPDLTFVHPIARKAMWRELKTTAGQLSPAQTRWLDAMAAAGLDVGVWRPQDLADRTIERALDVRGEQIARGRVA